MRELKTKFKKKTQTVADDVLHLRTEDHRVRMSQPALVLPQDENTWED